MQLETDRRTHWARLPPTCATDSSKSSGSAPFSLEIFLRDVNIAPPPRRPAQAPTPAGHAVAPSNPYTSNLVKFSPRCRGKPVPNLHTRWARAARAGGGAQGPAHRGGRARHGCWRERGAGRGGGGGGEQWRAGLLRAAPVGRRRHRCCFPPSSLGPPVVTGVIPAASPWGCGRHGRGVGMSKREEGPAGSGEREKKGTASRGRGPGLTAEGPGGGGAAGLTAEGGGEGGGPDGGRRGGRGAGVTGRCGWDEM